MTEKEDRTQEFIDRLSKAMSYSEREALYRDMAEDLQKHRQCLMDDIAKHFTVPMVRADLSARPHGRGFRRIEEDYQRMIAERRPYDFMPDLHAMRREREAREKRSDCRHSFPGQR